MTSSSSSSRTRRILTKTAIKRQQQQHTPQKELKQKAKIVGLGCQKDRARQAESVLSDMARQRESIKKPGSKRQFRRKTIRQKDTEKSI